ncbi:MAG: PD40 domain-containing protein [Anaerolineae bacterium]|nr:PD40 domain-containing protein [Anaerolineae bacterium]
MTSNSQTNARYRHRVFVIATLVMGMFFTATCGELPTPLPQPTSMPVPPLDPEYAGRIAFTAGRTGEREVYVMEVDGSNVINLTNNEADDWYPSWSWDRRQIAFVSDRDGSEQIYSMDVETRAVTRLTHAMSHYCCPAWAPDGKTIAFVSDQNENVDIYVLDVETRGTTRLTDNPANDKYPSWSTDGTRIAFASDRDGNWDIYTMNDEGGDVVNLTTNPGDDFQPTWSPNSNRIAFTSSRDGNKEIYIMNVDTQGVTPLTHKTEDEWNPSWTRDGRYIVFLRGNNDEEANVYLINADGSDEVRLTDKPIDRLTPAPSQSPPTDMPVPVPPTDVPTATPTHTHEPPTDTPSPVPATPTPAPATPTPTSVVPTNTPASPPTRTPAPTNPPPPLPSPGYFVVYTNCPSSDLQNCSVWGVRSDDANSAWQIVEHASEPVLSPTGEQLAFYRKDAGIYLWDFAQQSHSQIVLSSIAFFATWAPDSQKLAYYMEGGDRSIYVVDVDSLEFGVLTPGMRPSWSPKNEFIAYDSCDGTECGLFRISPQGDNLKQITTDGGASAAVSPDGTKIAYRASMAGGNEIFVINANGIDRQQLTHDGGNNVQPAWSPDGTYIFYLSDRGGKGWAVMKMTAGGEMRTTVVGVDGVSDLWQHQRISVTRYNRAIHDQE